MTIATYSGKVRSGQIELTDSVQLLEGSDVYVVVPSVSMVTEHQARQKATRWLVGQVGNMLMAGKGTLVHKEQAWIWSFPVFITASTHEPWGPLASILIDAETGQVINPQLTKSTLLENGRTFTRPVKSSAES